MKARLLVTLRPRRDSGDARRFRVLLAALAGRATHLLTADKRHVGPLFGKTIGPLVILPPGEDLRRRA
jgi:hypothetical protein